MAEVAVRLRTGPVHIADARTETDFRSACGKRFRGVSVVVPIREWRRGPRCPDCDEIADHSPTRLLLRLIAGW